MTSTFSDVLDERPPAPELRREGRVRTVYIPCCLRSGRNHGLGLIRNLSPAGLMVETAIGAGPGAEIEYFRESSLWCRARVVWREGSRLGLRQIGESARQATAFPPRAIRVPTSLMARLWLDGRPIEIGIGNVSHKGVLAFGVPPILPGRLFTLSIAGRDFAQTSLRWWADGSAGMQFARALPLRELTELIGRAEGGAAGFHFESRLGSLLEVVPANDAGD